jgi:AcrR family transcriptional regulator
MTDRNDKAAAILDSARVLMMDRGYNGFSFRDIAAEVGIKSASIHYHFATKADLAEATARAYREAFNAALDGGVNARAFARLRVPICGDTARAWRPVPWGNTCGGCVDLARSSPRRSHRVL